MGWVDTVAYVFGGAFLANAVPHFTAGLMGRPFQTPFASPPGVGLSSSTVNAAWGFFNIVIAYLLICRVGQFDLRANADVIAAGAGMLLLSLAMARRFGRFHGGNSPSNNTRA